MTTDDVLYDHKWVDEDYIGLDHMDKRVRQAEKAVFIRPSHRPPSVCASL